MNYREMCPALKWKNKMINDSEKNYESFVDILAKLSLMGPSEKVALLALELQSELFKLNCDIDSAEELIELF